MNIPVPPAILDRPRLLNPLHALGLVKPHTQTNSEELQCLGQYAEGHVRALEIGTHMGVSAGVIAGALAANGKLFCVDPWEPRKGRENPCLSICRRELGRRGVLDRVVFSQGYSRDVESSLPEEFDFIFVDGDHSFEGIEGDWQIVLRRLSKGGIVCLHDTTVPDPEPYRMFDSVTFFNEVIQKDPDFELLKCCYSMNVLRRL